MFDNPLVLEGGAMRGMYTAGALDLLMEKDMFFSYVNGVSAGALNALNYISGQKGRSARVCLNFVNDPRYLSLHNFLRGPGIFNFDFLFGDIAKTLDPFDARAFFANPARLVVVAADCRTGEAVPFEKGVCPDFFRACAASASMPLASRIVDMDGVPCLDGGVAEPFALDAALTASGKRPVLVLTREKGFRKPPLSPSMRALYHARFPRYPAVAHCQIAAPEKYNALLERVDKMEDAGALFVLRPSGPIGMSSMEKDPQKLESLYRRGYDETKSRLDELRAFLA